MVARGDGVSAYCCTLLSAVLSCAAELLVLRFVHNKRHHQIEITSCTGLLSTNERSRVPHHVIGVGWLAWLQPVGHYVACFS